MPQFSIQINYKVFGDPNLCEWKLVWVNCMRCWPWPLLDDWKLSVNGFCIEVELKIHLHPYIDAIFSKTKFLKHYYQGWLCGAYIGSEKSHLHIQNLNRLCGITLQCDFTFSVVSYINMICNYYLYNWILIF